MASRDGRPPRAPRRRRRAAPGSGSGRRGRGARPPGRPRPDARRAPGRRSGDADESAAPTSTRGAAASTSASSPAASTTRSTSTSSASSGSTSTGSPATGGALIVANHAGAIPPDAPAIMHGIEKELGRRVYGLAENLFRSVPVVGTLWARGGGVAAHPDNAYRLLHDEGPARARVPRGHEGHRQALHRALPAAPLRARRLRRDRDARGRAGDPDRGRRRRRGDADRVQEQPRRQGAGPPLLPGHGEHVDDGTARPRRVSARRSSGCACCRRCTSTSRPIRSATRAAG